MRRHRRRHVRKVAALRCADVVIHLGPLDFTPGERVVDHRRVVVIVMAHRAGKRILLRAPRQEGQMLTNLEPWRRGGDRLEGPANLGRRRGLEIPHVEMRRPAQQINQNARPRPTEMQRRFSMRQPRRHPAGQRQPAANAQKLPAIDRRHDARQGGSHSERLPTTRSGGSTLRRPSQNSRARQDCQQIASSSRRTSKSGAATCRGA